MKTRPICTLLLIIASIAITLMAPIFDYSIYGVNGHPTEWMSFAPSSPFRHYGLSLIASPFMHQNLAHLFTNILFLSPIALMIERKQSAKYLMIKFLEIHFLVLCSLALIETIYPMTGRVFLGTSHVVLGLYGFWGLKQKKYSLLILSSLVIPVGLWEGQSPLTVMAHALGLIIGIKLFVVGSVWNQFRAKGPN